MLTQQQQRHLHGGDVLEKVLDAPGAVPPAAGALEGQQREEPAVVGLIAEDLRGRAGAGGRTVQQGAQVVVKKDAEQKKDLPAAQYPGRATDAECAKQRAKSIHAITIQVPRFLRNFAAKEKMPQILLIIARTWVCECVTGVLILFRSIDC